MGWTPDMVRACSLSDFAAAFEGWRIAQGGEPPLSRKTADDALGLLDQYPKTRGSLH